MKELYTSPEAELICFAPAESLANSNVSFKDLLAGAGTNDPISSVVTDDELDHGVGL